MKPTQYEQDGVESNDCDAQLEEKRSSLWVIPTSLSFFLFKK